MARKISIYPILESEKKIKAETTQETSGNELCNRLSKLPFWCADNTIHLTKPDTYQDEFCCVTHVVGLLHHPATAMPMPLTPYQIDFVNRVIEATKAPTQKESDVDFKKILEEFLRIAHFFHLNKGRQMGFTEIVLRLIQFFCFTRYAGYNIGIMAATNGKLAHKDLRRFARLFKDIPCVVEQWVKSGTFRLVNGCIIEAFAASEEAITGDTRYKCILMDEAAKWKLVDDTPVFNSVEPVVRAAGGDLFLVSTPKGPIKMFYKIHDDKHTEYIKMRYSIHEAEGNLYTKSEIDRMLASKTSNPDQEYLLQFVTGEDSILGMVTDEDRDDKLISWDEQYLDEDDGFNEDESDTSIMDDPNEEW